MAPWAANGRCAVSPLLALLPWAAAPEPFLIHDDCRLAPCKTPTTGPSSSPENTSSGSGGAGG